MKKQHYFNFPLSLIQFIKDDHDRSGLLHIVAYSTLNFSEKFEVNGSSVANQIIYLYYRRPYFLTKSVKNRLRDMFDDGKLIEDEDYHGFSGDKFTPETENEGLMLEFAEDSNFYSQCVTIYKEHQALALLGLNPELIADIRGKYNEVKKFIESFEIRNGPDAWTSVSNNLIFEVFNGRLPMDFLRLISAVKSVLGKRNFNLTYKSVLLCRMFGSKKMNILNEFFNDNPDLRVKHDMLSRRRQWEKLIETASEKGLFAYYCTGRNFFVSVTMSSDEIQKAISIKKEAEIKIEA